ncbi:MAG: GNAT family N-acetyltransferase [Phycisphaerae bacterium]|nr:GNAT family N-acetyltransferase [Saprospiraceae bacterium]
MEFLNSTTSDLDTIFELYDAAIAHQKAVSHMHWLPFDRLMVEAEIAEGRQWKIVIEDEIACVFVTAYTDAAIWGEKDLDPSVYLHRIVTNPAFRGRNFAGHITQWALRHGTQLGKKFVRLDTWAENMKLKEVYLRNGFQFLGNAAPADPTALPSHYSGIVLGFYEIAID